MPTRWFNPSQPETLRNATILLYLSAVFALLGGSMFYGVGLAVAIAQGVGGLGIANERRAGYAVAIAVAVFDVGRRVLLFLQYHYMPDVLGFLFAVALLALLLHERSRSYQKIWFR